HHRGRIFAPWLGPASRVAGIGHAPAIIRPAPGAVGRITVRGVAIRITVGVAVIGHAAAAGITTGVRRLLNDDRRDGQSVRIVATPTRAATGHRITARNGRPGATAWRAFAKDRAKVGDLSGLLLLAHESFGLGPRIVADRVNDHARFLNRLNVAVVTGAVAVPVHAVRENDDGFAPLDASQMNERELHRVIEFRPLPGPRLLNRAEQS